MVRLNDKVRRTFGNLVMRRNFDGFRVRKEKLNVVLLDKISSNP